MSDAQFPTRYAKPFQDRYHPEKYRDTRFRRATSTGKRQRFATDQRKGA